MIEQTAHLPACGFSLSSFLHPSGNQRQALLKSVADLVVPSSDRHRHLQDQHTGLSAGLFDPLGKSTAYVFGIHKALDSNPQPMKISIVNYPGDITTFFFLKSPLGLCVTRR